MLALNASSSDTLSKATSIYAQCKPISADRAEHLHIRHAYANAALGQARTGTLQILFGGCITPPVLIPERPSCHY
jgi:hypothetical protein